MTHLSAVFFRRFVNSYRNLQPLTPKREESNVA